MDNLDFGELSEEYRPLTAQLVTQLKLNCSGGSTMAQPQTTFWFKKKTKKNEGNTNNLCQLSIKAGAVPLRVAALVECAFQKKHTLHQLVGCSFCSLLSPVDIQRAKTLPNHCVCANISSDFFCLS